MIRTRTIKPRTTLCDNHWVAILVTMASWPLAAQENEEVFGRELMTQTEFQEHRENGVGLKNGMGQGPGQGMGKGQGMGSGGNGKNQEYKIKGSGGQSGGNQ